MSGKSSRPRLIGTVSALLHPDARFDQTRIPDGGVYEGREACGRFFEHWFGTWDEIRMTPERFIDSDACSP